MNHDKSLSASLLLALVFAGAACAMAGTATGWEAGLAESTGPTLAVGQTCADPIVISSLPYAVYGRTTCGFGNDYFDTCLGLFDGGEDIVYRLDLDTAKTVNIVMNPYTTSYAGILLDTSCPPDATTCIAASTATNGFHNLLNQSLAAGSYYIMIDTRPTPNNCIPQFSLQITEVVPPPPPPANDTCEGAIDLQSLTSNTFTVDTCDGYTNNYDAGGVVGCTGYWSAGLDATYKIYLQLGETFTVWSQCACLGQIWLVTDCSNAAATCVAGAAHTTDNPSAISYTAAATGWYYLILDSYEDYNSNCGLTTVTIDAPVATEMLQWGGVKAMFR
jgi:hypothetical protein